MPPSKKECTCPPPKVQNPVTGRCINPTSKTGKQVLFDLANPKCKILVFHKATPTLKRLVKKAEEQKSNFFRIFPWEDDFHDDSTVMFVATANDQICGWLTARHRKAHLYIAKISARSAVDKDNTLFKGVGFALFERAKQYAISEGLAFINLFPINKRVSQIYERWGFQGNLPFKAPDPLNDGKTMIEKQSENMYLVLDKSRWPAILQKLHKHEPSHDIKEILDYLTAAQKTKLRKLRKTNPEAFDDTVMHLLSLLEAIENGEKDNDSPCSGVRCGRRYVHDEKLVRAEFRAYFKTI